MKILFVVLCYLFTLTFETSKHSDVKELEITPAEFQNMVVAFLHSIHIDLISDATLPCKASINAVIDTGAQAFENFVNENYFQGTLDTADALALTSPVARNCTKGINQITTEVYNYINSFEDFRAWMDQIMANVKSNIAMLTITSTQLSMELSKSPLNFERIGDLSGQVAYLTFRPNVTYPGLTYTRADPLAPAPMNEVLWITMESIYEFLTSARLVNSTLITDCQGAALNMLLFHCDAYNNFQDENVQEAIFLTLDSFTFLHPLIDHCYHSGVQIVDTSNRVLERIGQNPHVILENFNNDMFHVISGSMATYAQIYHRDFISLSRVFGGVVYRTLITGA